MAHVHEIIVLDWKLRADENYEIFQHSKDNFSADAVYVSKNGIVEARIQLNRQNLVKTSAREGIQVNISFNEKIIFIVTPKPNTPL